MLLQVVPRMLQVLRGLQDRLAALQLTLRPPGISGACTGVYMVHFLVPMRDRTLALFGLLTQLADATARELAQPCPKHVAAVQDLVRAGVPRGSVLCVCCWLLVYLPSRIPLCADRSAAARLPSTRPVHRSHSWRSTASSRT